MSQKDQTTSRSQTLDDLQTLDDSTVAGTVAHVDAANAAIARLRNTDEALRTAMGTAWSGYNAALSEVASLKTQLARERAEHLKTREQLARMTRAAERAECPLCTPDRDPVVCTQCDAGGAS